jgi:hypothetical protein
VVGRRYLYVRPDLQQELQPKTTGWMAHEAPFAFDTELRYAPGIARFLHGSPAIPALYAAEFTGSPCRDSEVHGEQIEVGYAGNDCRKLQRARLSLAAWNQIYSNQSEG